MYLRFADTGAEATSLLKLIEEPKDKQQSAPTTEEAEAADATATTLVQDGSTAAQVAKEVSHGMYYVCMCGRCMTVVLTMTGFVLFSGGC